MKRFLMLILALTLAVAIVQSTDAAPVIWNGAKITFTKTNGTDWNLAENQDRITDKVWITRQNVEGIYNIKTELGYADDSPADTEWATGSAVDYASLTFQKWEDWHGENPSSVLNLDAVLHLITDDIYIDIKFTSWTTGRGKPDPDRGGFRYVRSNAPVPLPSTVLFLASGLIGLIGFVRVRRQKA
jgi:hypothetical protein